MINEQTNKETSALYSKFAEIKLPDLADERWRRTDPEDFDPRRLFVKRSVAAVDVEKLKVQFADNVHQGLQLLQSCFVLCLANGKLVQLSDHRIPEENIKFSIIDSVNTNSSLEGLFAIGDVEFFGSREFSTVHFQVSQQNVLIEIAKNYKVEKPLVFFVSKDNETMFQSTYLRLNAFSELEYLEVRELAEYGAQSASFVHVGESAKLRCSAIIRGVDQKDCKLLHHFDASLGPNAQYSFVGVWADIRSLRSFLSTRLLGSGASSDIRGIMIGRSRQHMDIEPSQLHVAPNTTSNMVFKTALRDRARAVFQGEIVVKKQAQNTNAVQMNKNLLLSKQARVDSLPKLNILPDQVSCKHGAATGYLDPEHIHYLMARGFDRSQATQLIIQSFFSDLVSVLQDSEIKDVVGAELVKLAQDFARDSGL